MPAGTVVSVYESKTLVIGSGDEIIAEIVAEPTRSSDYGVYGGWSIRNGILMVDTPVTVTEDTDCIATFNPPRHNLTLLSEPEGVLDINSDEEVLSVAYGSEIQIYEDGYKLSVSYLDCMIKPSRSTGASTRTDSGHS